MCFSYAIYAIHAYMKRLNLRQIATQLKLRYAYNAQIFFHFMKNKIVK